MSAILAFVMAHAGWILWILSELIAIIPGFKSSSVGQAVFAFIQDLMNKVSSPAAVQSLDKAKL